MPHAESRMSLARGRVEDEQRIAAPQKSRQDRAGGWCGNGYARECEHRRADARIRAWTSRVDPRRAAETATTEAPANRDIAEPWDAFAGLLDLDGSSFYTSRAYRRAAETIRDTLAPVAELVREGRVRELRGIGPGIAAKLAELVETGTIAELDELEQDFAVRS